MPRVLVDVSKINTETTILGVKVASPICIAPTAMQKMAHPEGEIATAKAAAQYDIHFLSPMSNLCYHFSYFYLLTQAQHADDAVQLEHYLFRGRRTGGARGL